MAAPRRGWACPGAGRRAGGPLAACGHSSPTRPSLLPLRLRTFSGRIPPVLTPEQRRLLVTQPRACWVPCKPSWPLRAMLVWIIMGLLGRLSVDSALRTFLVGGTKCEISLLLHFFFFLRKAKWMKLLRVPPACKRRPQPLSFPKVRFLPQSPFLEKSPGSGGVHSLPPLMLGLGLS